MKIKTKMMLLGKGALRKTKRQHIVGLMMAALILSVAALSWPVRAQQRVLRAPFFSDANWWGTNPAYWKTIQFPDINGDGRKDVCGRASNGIWCALNNFFDFAPPTKWTPSFGDDSGWASHPSHWATIRFPDLNGDGKADVCGRAFDGIHCALSNGASFEPLSKWDAHSTFSDQNRWNTDPSYWETIQFPDINGDGKADVCGRGFSAYGGMGIVCRENYHGQVFAPDAVRSNFFSDANQWHTKRSFWGTIRFPDLNGDGKADVCGRWADGLWCGLSDGHFFNQPTLWSNLYSDSNIWDSHESYWGTIQYADINGDRKADVCGRGADGLYCGEAIVPTSGSPRFNTTGQVHVPVFNNSGGWRWDGYYKTIRLVDVNGDGRADACGRGINGIQCALARTYQPPLFSSAISWLAQFGDNPFAMSESYWGTVQPADVDYRISLNGAEWCGRGPDGVKCYVR